MKRFSFKAACAALAACIALVFTACSGGGSSQQESAAAEITTAAASAVEQTTAAAFKKEADLTTLHSFKDKGDQFSGVWKITEGTGSQLKSFVFKFDGGGNAYLMVGTMGYCGVYTITSEDGQDLFTTKLVFGLDGQYTYQFTKDRKTVTLTNIKDNTTTIMEKVDSFNSIPDPVENPEIDENLLGTWLDDTGEYLYFGKDGIMYQTQKNISFSFYNYSAKNGVINETYTMTTEMTETASYSVDGDTLTYDGYQYNRISADELL